MNLYHFSVAAHESDRTRDIDVKAICLCRIALTNTMCRKSALLSLFTDFDELEAQCKFTLIFINYLLIACFGDRIKENRRIIVEDYSSTKLRARDEPR
mgnify:FL=1